MPVDHSNIDQLGPRGAASTTLGARLRWTTTEGPGGARTPGLGHAITETYEAAPAAMDPAAAVESRSDFNTPQAGMGSCVRLSGTGGGLKTAHCKRLPPKNLHRCRRFRQSHRGDRTHTTIVIASDPATVGLVDVGAGPTAWGGPSHRRGKDGLPDSEGPGDVLDRTFDRTRFDCLRLSPPVSGAFGHGGVVWTQDAGVERVRTCMLLGTTVYLKASRFPG